MKKWLILVAVVAALGAPSAQADGGNWLSYLKIDGCSCSYGSFSSSATKFVVDGPQASVGSSKSPITISTGNQTQAVKVSFSTNGIPIGATSSDSGQQDGVYFTSAPIYLQPGTNVITFTVSDPTGILKPTTVTLTVPYRPVTLTNSAVPTVSGTNGNLQDGQAPKCDTGTWTADPTPTLTVSWQGSPDGRSWSQLSSPSVASSPYYKYLRCQVVANNGYSTVTAYSTSIAVLAPDVFPVIPNVATVAKPALTPVSVPTAITTSTSTPASVSSSAVVAPTLTAAVAPKATPARVPVVTWKPRATPVWVTVDRPDPLIRVYRYEWPFAL